MERITKTQLLELFDESVRARLESALGKEGVDGLIVYEDAQIRVQYPARTAVVYGPGCTFKSVETSAKWLNDLPTMRQYPRCYYQKDEEENGSA